MCVFLRTEEDFSFKFRDKEGNSWKRVFTLFYLLSLKSSLPFFVIVFEFVSSLQTSNLIIPTTSSNPRRTPLVQVEGV